MPKPLDLVLSGGGVLGIGHAGAVSVLEEHGFEFKRIAGTSAGSIVGALLAAGKGASQLGELIAGLEYQRFLDRDALDRVPLFGPPLSVLLEDGYAEGEYFKDWIEAAGLGKRTFGDLRIDDDQRADPRAEHKWWLTVMAADVTRGQLLRLPQDYERYGLPPDEQPVVDAVRASISVPYLFEPFKLEHPGGESLLVDGGLISNFPIDVFDRTDGEEGRWPTVGVSLIPQLPAEATRLVPQLGPPGAAGFQVLGGRHHNRCRRARPGLPEPALGQGADVRSGRPGRQPVRLHDRPKDRGAPFRERPASSDRVPRARSSDGRRSARLAS